ncbi:MAG: hypothetical protein VX335_03700 [Pseudomonadota bacterium]|nr:hypothetical protein [Pseudomonadota bacterium]
MKRKELNIIPSPKRMAMSEKSDNVGLERKDSSSPDTVAANITSSNYECDSGLILRIKLPQKKGNLRLTSELTEAITADICKLQDISIENVMPLADKYKISYAELGKILNSYLDDKIYLDHIWPCLEKGLLHDFDCDEHEIRQMGMYEGSHSSGMVADTLNHDNQTNKMPELTSIWGFFSESEVKPSSNISDVEERIDRAGTFSISTIR